MEQSLGGLGTTTLGKIFWLILAHCKSCAQDRKTIVLEIMVLYCFLEKKIVLLHFVFFSVNSKIHAISWT